MTQTSQQAHLDRLPAAPSRLRVAAALGPAFVAAIAYLDPGNFATNFAGGSSTGYRLVWVVVLANVVAMPIQYLAAKLGIVTGRSLPQLCRETMPRRTRWFMWGQAEIVAMATDLAEFVGAAIGLNLLFDMPLPVAAGVTVVLAYAVLAFQRRGHRPFELAVGSMLALICIGFLYLTLRIPPSATEVLNGLVPSFAGSQTLLLAVGIIGATVMPHAIYLHSGLMSSRMPSSGVEPPKRLLHFARIDIGIAMGIAGLVNLSMLVVAAKLFYQGGDSAPIGLDEVHSRLAETVGGSVALAFAAALLASGISSSSVGTAAGQIIMDGFLNLRIPIWLRRAITMAPAVILLTSGIDPTKALVLSQVALSFGIPFALGALLWLTSRRRIMGDHVNTPAMTAGMLLVVAVLSGLNLMLLGQQIAGWLGG
ncbi:Nramp family divalent metal transporter [Paractinoplanes ferrugineus]|uniref:Divalent metal cation transporter MntH n=1 Tax=Paractinoplanes ferrugineus TaxID=113564 RepID=A0A919J9D3_9ACTN|nr:Nramp family divalent metal transporter [Actinoplanes ferrugineus]GIE15672.1 divalent metal cation transporter MntH [Actinoplanes ferrugineus]